MPGISSLQFDTTGWNLKQQTDTRCIWSNQARDVLTLELFPGSTSLPAHLHDAAGWLQYYEPRVSKEGGAVVSVDLLPLGGLDAVRSIFKFRNPHINDLSPLGMTYLGSWMLPRGEFCYVIKVQCFEYGATGTREATVAVIRPDLFPPAHEPPKLVNSAEELFSNMAQSPVKKSPADDIQYDVSFPHHPLSRTRAYLKAIQQTFHADQDVITSKPA